MGEVAATFCATLVDEWLRAGVSRAFISPGSRSTPLALALAARAEMRCEIVLDERVAAYMALGSGLADGVPAVVLTTSGTAVTHLHGAVVEAHLSEVPMLVCTADRPPELQGVGAAQTIDQRRVFGSAARSYLDLGVPDEHNRSAWRSLAARAFADATGVPAGPVQLNLGFREPLVGVAAPLPPGRDHARPWHRRVLGVAGPPAELAEELASSWTGRRGVVLAGAGVDDPAAVLALAERLGWPVLADPRSGCRVEQRCVVAHADALVRIEEWAAAMRPEVVLRLGEGPASKVVTSWVTTVTTVTAAVAAGGTGAASGPAELVVVNDAGSWWDPDRRAGLIVGCPPGRFASAVCAALADAAADDRTSVGPDGWLSQWRRADDLAAAALAEVLGGEAGNAPPNEPAVARATWEAACRHGAAAVMVSSSMPVRDLEWYVPRSPLGAVPPVVLANRGANGIDGVVATGAGAAVAVAPAPVWVLIGDLALLHDTNALLDLGRRDVCVRIVVVDNGGGGIFSFLPQATLVPEDVFERLFGTQQAVDVADVLRAHRVPTTVVERADELVTALDGMGAASGPVAAVVVRAAARPDNVAVHGRLHAGVASAVRAADGKVGATAGRRPG